MRRMEADLLMMTQSYYVHSQAHSSGTAVWVYTKLQRHSEMCLIWKWKKKMGTLTESYMMNYVTMRSKLERENPEFFWSQSNDGMQTWEIL